MTPRTPAGTHRARAHTRACVVATAVLVAGLAAVACSGSSSGSAAASRNDPAAARALERSFERGARTPWLVRSTFDRRLTGGRSLRDAITELNRPPDTHLNVALGTLAGTLRGKPVDCSTSGGAPTCSPDATATAPDAGADAIRTVTDPRLAWYTVRRIGSRTVLGRPASCFRVAVTPKAGQLDFGLRTDLCFLASGIPVRKVVVRKAGTDTTNATAIVQTVTDADIDAATAPFRSPG